MTEEAGCPYDARKTAQTPPAGEGYLRGLRARLRTGRFTWLRNLMRSELRCAGLRPVTNSHRWYAMTSEKRQKMGGQGAGHLGLRIHETFLLMPFPRSRP